MHIPARASACAAVLIVTCTKDRGRPHYKSSNKAWCSCAVQREYGQHPRLTRASQPLTLCQQWMAHVAIATKRQPSNNTTSHDKPLYLSVMLPTVSRQVPAPSLASFQRPAMLVRSWLSS